MSHLKIIKGNAEQESGYGVIRGNISAFLWKAWGEKRQQIYVPRSRPEIFEYEEGYSPIPPI
jgi:hypothetical protein